MKRHLYYLVFLLAVSCSVFSQRGKDGAGVITVANTIVNLYTPLTANASTGNTSISVASTAGLSTGDLIYIIQIQGASVNAGKDSIFPDFNSAIPTNTTFGAVTNYNNCGNHEFAQVASIPNGTTINLDCGLQKNYSAINKVQVLRVPRYTTLTVSSGFISCPAWNGTTGGVAVVEVMSNATLTAVPSFSVTGMGFRGGGVENVSTAGGNKFGSVLPAEGAYKGESIAGDTTRYKAYSSVFCRGSIANGGGGGDAHNAGGGGGSNGGNILTYDGLGNPVAGYNAAWNLEGGSFSTHTSSGGGRGGYTFSSANANPSTVAPGSGTWSGDTRRNVGGLGGHPLDYSTGRLFLGGGGGTGDSNDGYGAPGGNGGGLVYVLCYGNISGAGTIVADGAKGSNTNNSGAGCTGKDGASGGGGGGTIVLNIAGTINLTAATALSAKGGNGGNQNYGVGCFSTEAYGTGGSGGGGYIGVSGTLPGNSVAAGAYGIVTGNSSNIASQFPPNGATNGGPGTTGTVTLNLISSTNQTICLNTATTLTATASAGGSTINWFNVAAGGAAVGSGTAFATPTYTAVGVYTVYAGSCPGSYRQPVTINVINGPTLTVNTPSICAGSTATLTAGGATTYTWSTGSNASSISVNPAGTTTYTLSGTVATCSASVTATVNVIPTPTVSATSVSICTNQTATLTASGAASFTWNPGGATGATFTAAPVSTTNYTVTGATGSCTASGTATITVVPIPTVSATSATICSGSVATLTASGASTYTWNPGGITGSTFTASPSSNATYTVTGASASCSSTAVGSVSVAPAVTITVNSPTICPGASTVLTASGAASYTWSTGPATSTIAVSPTVTTNYTVTGSNGVCTSGQTATVNVNTPPTVSATSASLCAGTSATLTASGAASYTWSPGALTGSLVVVSPGSTQTYTIIGADAAGCTGTATSDATVVPNPTVTASSATVCAGQTATLIAVGATTYTWTGGVTGSSYTITPAGNSTVSVIGSSSTCTASATASVTVGTALSITINTPTICAGQSVTLTATSPATSYTWTPGGATTSTIVVNPSATTSYTVDGSSGACSGSGTTTVTVNNNPTVTVTGSAICSGQTVTLTASGAGTYTWQPTGTNGSTLTANPGTSTTYSVTGTLLGCNNSSSFNVTVTPTPTLTVNSPTTCGGAATLTANGAANYTWTPGASTLSSIVVTPTTTSNYTVTGANGNCVSTATTNVVVTTAPTLTISSDISSACSNACVTFSGTAGYSPITFNFGDGSTPLPGTMSNCYTVTGVYTVTASGTYSSGCTNSSANTLTITINQAPVASFTTGSANPFTASVAVTFSNTSSGASNSYAWSFGDGNVSTLVDPSDTYVNAGNYCVKLVATDTNNGCRDSVMHCYDVDAPVNVIVPNIFTPNNDGVNDVFKVSGVGIKDLNCAIFDRWGLKMYEWQGIGGSWDGKARNGTSVPTGTYFYLISYTTADGTTTKTQGTLTLMKE